MELISKEKFVTSFFIVSLIYKKSVQENQYNNTLRRKSEFDSGSFSFAKFAFSTNNKGRKNLPFLHLVFFEIM